jgi:hypothetical protein
MTALQNFISRIEEQIVFDPSLRSVEATYKRRINNGERLSVVKFAYFPIYPLQISATAIGEGERAFTGGVIPREVIRDESLTIARYWVRVEDLKWCTGEPFEPEVGDEFTYAGHDGHHCIVTNFAYETVLDSKEHAVIRLVAKEGV